MNHWQVARIALQYTRIVYNDHVTTSEITKTELSFDYITLRRIVYE